MRATSTRGKIMGAGAAAVIGAAITFKEFADIIYGAGMLLMAVADVLRKRQ